MTGCCSYDRGVIFQGKTRGILCKAGSAGKSVNPRLKPPKTKKPRMNNSCKALFDRALMFEEAFFSRRKGGAVRGGSESEILLTWGDKGEE